MARILAHEINHIPYTDDSPTLDIIEIDAASNNGVEDVRQLRELVRIAPTAAPKKVYIIDEVHMLSKPAFNALLKTLEEPPEHVVFILATTDVEKLPATIVSRTQRFSFHAIRPDDIVAHLKTIAHNEKITITDDALHIIAARGDGSFRDSISLLDQLSNIATGKDGITVERIESALGLASAGLIEKLLQAVDEHNVRTLASLLADAEAEGTSSLILTDQLTRTLRDRVIQKPRLLPLLDSLLEVPRSPMPSMKLLTVLGLAAQEAKPKNMALLTQTREVSAPIKKLQKMATQPAPQMSSVTAPQADAMTAVASSSPEPPSPTHQPTTKPSATAQSQPFDWNTLIAATKKNDVALYSVLSKCGYAFNNNELTVYTNNAFYKKKLDDPKYQPHLYESLENVGYSGVTITTIPSRPPIKNSQAAAIADIMGGGIEVSLEKE